MKIKKWCKLYKNWYLRILNHRLLLKKEKIQMNLRNGIKFKIVSNSNDDGMLEEIWINNVYTPNKFVIHENDVIVDIGAQKGFFSIFAGINNNVKVYSFEPEPLNFSFLQENVKLNGLEKNIFIFNLAVAKNSGKKRLFIDESNTGGHSMFTKTGNFLNVNCITLPEIMESHKLNKINLLKMDCEGAEYEILFNTEEKFFKKIDKIVMEAHEFDNHRIVDIEKFLIKLEYIVNKSGPYLYARRVPIKCKS
jgi:FkbM family methyltransferase